MARTKLANERQEAINEIYDPVADMVFNEDTPVISTGSLLLDLAISGSVFPRGGLPGGVLVEIFGPSGSGKTVMACQIAGNVAKQGGQIMFSDPEARLDAQFAKMFGLDVANVQYILPDTVVEAFSPMHVWEPEPENLIHGAFVDSLAALSTAMEMKEQDKMGMKRAKDFSEMLRKTCRRIAKKKFLVVCSNQVRQNVDAGPYGEQEAPPGGKAVGFYASIRLKCYSPKKIKVKKKIHGIEQERVIGTTTQITVYKNSIDKPFREAPVTIVFDYGIDAIRDNLNFVKKYRGETTYIVGGESLSRSRTEAIHLVEEKGLEAQLEKEVIQTWREIEAAFSSGRKAKE